VPGPQQQQQRQSQEPDYAFIATAIDPVLATVTEAFGSPVISYFLDDGSNAALADEQMLHLYEHLRRVGRHDTLGLWLSSRGGATEVPWKIVSLFREFATRFVVLVPYRAHSAATLTAVGADEIVMTEMSELGPVDPTRRHPLLPTEDQPNGKKVPIPISVQDLRHVLKFLQRELGEDIPPEVAATIYTALFEKVHPLAIGALEQSWALAQQVCERVLSTHMDPGAQADEIKSIVDKLSDFYKSHLYQINRKEAKEIGLKVRDATAAEAEAMWALYNAYANLRVEGEGEVNGKKARVGRVGHINSVAGTTIGVVATQLDDATMQVTSWQSKWRLGPGGSPLPA
jgi:hypothetical protein